MLTNLNVVQTLLLFAILVGGVVYGIIQSRNKTMSDSIDAMDKRINALKDDLAECHTALASSEAQRIALETSNKMLEKLSTGIPDWAMIHKGMESLNTLLATYLTPVNLQRSQDHYKVTEDILKEVRNGI